MRTAIVFKSTLLPYSETFIREQILACRDWRIILLGRRRIPGLNLGHIDVRLMETSGASYARRILGAIRWRLGLADPRIIQVLRREQPLLLHAHFGGEGVRAEPIARALGIPLLVTLHGVDINASREYWESGRGGWQMRSYPRRLLKLAHHSDTHFIAVSDAIRRRAIDFGIPAVKVSTLYTGVDTIKFLPGDMPIARRGRSVLFVGRLVEKKGCEYLIRAMASVRRRIVDASLTIVGDGPLQDRLEDLARRCGVAVKFLGVLQPDRVLAELHAARVFCLPSVQAKSGDAEGFGMVILEAQAAGVPVITSANGGAVEGLLDGATGFRVPPGDVEALADRITLVLSDDALATSMATAARKYVVANFDIRSCTEKLSCLYERYAQQAAQSLC